MRCACLAATAKGAALAERVRGALLAEEIGVAAADIFAKDGTAASDEAQTYERLAPLVAEIFPRYDALIFIMATGIAVRMIAPHIVSKLSDPAVLVMDERGQHVISLLSGHVGGANRLTYLLSKAIAAKPVITTATDVNGLLAPDSLAEELHLRPHPKVRIKAINTAVLAGEKIKYLVDMDMRDAYFFYMNLGKRKLLPQYINLGKEDFPPDGWAVLLTDKSIRYLPLNVLCLAPRRLIAGVGCRRGVAAEAILEALAAACAKIGRSAEAISALASTNVKKDEAGLLQAAEKLAVPIKFFSNAKLQKKIDKYRLEESEFVKKQIGVGNVCEAAALCCVTYGSIALPKTKFEKVTVALIWEK